MKASIKNRWTKALRRAKEYIQGESELFAGVNEQGQKEMCCLGVLCDLYAKTHGRKWGKNSVGERSMFGQSSYLPPQVVKWAGMVQKPEDDYLNPLIGNRKADKLNDVDKLSFEEIATLIEKNYKTI